MSYRAEHRGLIRRRRAIAVLVAAAVTVAIWLLLIRGGEVEPEPAAAAPAPAAVSGATANRLAELSTEEKIAELVLGAHSGDEVASGGVLVTAERWPGAAGAPKYVESLRDARDGPIPPLIVARQEGGEYRELADLPPNELALEIGDLADPARAREWSEQLAVALADAGFDLNLGPVADIATLDSPIADRAFSDDPAVATAMTAAALAGCRRGGIACAPAHFPGLGGASQDTDTGPATVGVDPATLRGRELGPFVAAFRGGAHSVVVSHGLYAAYDPVTPASLSPEILDGLLRAELGFDGVAITDDLEAGAIRSSRRVPDAAAAAIAAGADMVQISDPDDVTPALRAIEAAVRSGRISGQRLYDAAGRVLELKLRLDLLEGG